MDVDHPSQAWQGYARVMSHPRLKKFSNWNNQFLKHKHNIVIATMWSHQQKGDLTRTGACDVNFLLGLQSTRCTVNIGGCGRQLGGDGNLFAAQEHGFFGAEGRAGVVSKRFGIAQFLAPENVETVLYCGLLYMIFVRITVFSVVAIDYGLRGGSQFNMGIYN